MAYTFQMTNRWLILNFSVLGAVVVLVTMLLSISLLSNEVGLAALCVSSAMAFTSSGELWSLLYHGLLNAQLLCKVYWTCQCWTSEFLIQDPRLSS